MAVKAIPLNDLLKKGSKFIWNNECEDSWQTIKDLIVRDESLELFETNGKVKTYLTKDASDVGMGAVLEQQQKDGLVKPVIYWSSRFRKYERNYSIGEKETLTCVASMTHFKKYLLGRDFVLRTDHRALFICLSQGSTKVSAART